MRLLLLLLAPGTCGGPLACEEGASEGCLGWGSVGGIRVQGWNAPVHAALPMLLLLLLLLFLLQAPLLLLLVRYRGGRTERLSADVCNAVAQSRQLREDGGRRASRGYGGMHRGWATSKFLPLAHASAGERPGRRRYRASVATLVASKHLRRSSFIKPLLRSNSRNSEWVLHVTSDGP